MKQSRHLPLISALFVSALALQAQAQNNGGSLSAYDEAQLQQKAKMRWYPGGRDEEPLQVQSSLPLMTRRLQPAQEPVEIPDEAPEPTHDD
jgi:hypothetical protein